MSQDTGTARRFTPRNCPIGNRTILNRQFATGRNIPITNRSIKSRSITCTDQPAAGLFEGHNDATASLDCSMSQGTASPRRFTPRNRTIRNRTIRNRQFATGRDIPIRNRTIMSRSIKSRSIKSRSIKGRSIKGIPIKSTNRTLFSTERGTRHSEMYVACNIRPALCRIRTQKTKNTSTRCATGWYAFEYRMFKSLTWGIKRIT